MAQEASVPRDLWARIQKMIDASIAQFARSGFLRNARITGGAGLTVAEGGSLNVAGGGGVNVSGGGGVTLAGGGSLTITDGGEAIVLYPASLGGGIAVKLGDIINVATGAYNGTGILVQAPDGTDMMAVRTDAATGKTLHNIFDSGEQVIFGNDPVSGQGMARPYLSGAFYRTRFADWGVATVSGTFETLWSTRMYKQHPHLHVGVRASMDTSGTTGELRVMVNGQPFGAAQAVAFSTGFFTFGPGAVAGAHMSTIDVDIQARRTSASGALRVEPWHAPLGRQSP